MPIVLDGTNGVVLDGSAGIIINENVKTTNHIAELADLGKVIAMNKGPAVASISITVGKSPAVDAAIDRLHGAGILPVVAASNTNTDACRWSPSGTPNAFTVAGINKNDQRTNTSAFGECVDIFAPGGLIDSEDWQRPSAFKTMTGTSMATPHVAGVAALYLEKNPSARPNEVAKALRAGALAGVVVDAKSTNGNYLLNTAFLGGSVAPATNLVNAPTITPTPTPVAATSIPARPTAVFASKGSVGYRLAWRAPTNANTSGIIGYRVESSATGSRWDTVLVTSTADPVADVAVAGFYRVTAIGSLGASQPSLTVRVR
jgi:subtilisin family serine protease